MKKKLLLLTMLMAFSFTGCGKSYQEAENLPVRTVTTGNGYFTVVKTWDEGVSTNYIVYANDTKVKYFIHVSGYSYGITPLYNTDGSLQIYENEVEED